MKIGLAAIAGNAAANEVQAGKLRERDEQRFQWEKQRTESDLSLLPDRTEAAKTGLALQTAQNNANLGMVDQQTANAKDKLGLEAAELQGAKARQPGELLAKANLAKVQSLLSDFQLDQLPGEIARKKAQGVISDADIYVASIGKLSELLSSNDTGAIVRYMNGMNDAGVFGAKHAPVASVRIVDDPKHGPTFQAVDANGKNVLNMTADAMRRVRDSIGKSEVKSVNAGDTLVQVKGGKATPIYTAPDSNKSKGQRMGPLERDVEYLVSSHGMTPDQALAHLNSAKTMSRDQFVLKSVQDQIAMGKQPTTEQIDGYGQLYDRAHSAGVPKKPGSNSGQAPNLDPQIKSLIGIP